MKKELKTNKTIFRIGKFAIIGAILALFNFTIYTFLARIIFNTNELLWLASIISYTLATILAYILHSKITWKERPVTKKGIFMFFIWNGLTAFAVSPFLTWLFGYIKSFYQFVFNISANLHLPFDYEFIESTVIFITVTAITMVLNYLFYNKLIFGDQPTAQDVPKPLKNKGLVSVIVPVYNTAKYLPSCLDSIINQTYQNLEILCINDGSTDNSAKILQNYAKKDSRIKIITQKNQGLSSARNTGLKHVTGKYITFIDSDDEIEPSMISELLNAIIKTGSDISVCSMKETYPNGKVKIFPHDLNQKTYSTKHALKAMLKEENFNLTATMKLYKANIIKNLKFPIGKLHEDVGFTYEAIMRAKKITFVPKNYYIYHHNNSSIVSKFSNQKFDLIELTDKMCDEIDQKYPELKDTTNERRMRARFSLLRQIPLNHKRKKELLDYLNTHKTYITKNPEASAKDKLALKLAIISPKLFQLAYKLFK